MNVATITQKGQATIPAKVRKALGLHPGDKISFEITDGDVIVKKIQAFDYEYHRSLTNTLSEWTSEDDEEAYEDL